MPEPIRIVVHKRPGQPWDDITVYTDYRGLAVVCVIDEENTFLPQKVRLGERCVTAGIWVSRGICDREIVEQATRGQHDAIESVMKHPDGWPDDWDDDLAEDDSASGRTLKG